MRPRAQEKALVHVDAVGNDADIFERSQLKQIDQSAGLVEVEPGNRDRDADRFRSLSVVYTPKCGRTTAITASTRIPSNPLMVLLIERPVPN